MIVDGIELPYVEVERSFAQSPPSFDYEARALSQGGARLRYKRLNPLEFTIPVTYSRRGHESKTWDDVRTEVAERLYNGVNPKMIAFKHGDGKYYIAEVVDLNIADEYEYVAKGSITIFSGYPCRFGSGGKLEIGAIERTHEIKGQTSTPWRSKTIFTAPASSYTIESSTGKLVLNFDFVIGDVLEIDYESRSITLNGVNIDVGLSLASVWFILDVGYMTMSATHKTEMTYTERYY